MAFKGQHNIYETTFDAKVTKKSEDNLDLIDRIASHPLVQHFRRRLRQSANSGHQNNGQAYSRSTFYTAMPSTSSDPDYQVGLFTPKSGRRGPSPARSISTSQLTEWNFRPIGFSKSDDKIVNHASDSPDEEDYLEDYREGSDAKNLAKDLHSLHVSIQSPFSSVALIASPGLSINGRDKPVKKPSQLVRHSSARIRSSDKFCILQQSSTRPFTTSLSKIGSRVQPEKDKQTPRAHLIQGGLSKSQLLPHKRILKPLKLHSPPGTAPLPVKFSKKTPISEKSPSSWFSPIRLKYPEITSKTGMAKRTADSSSSSLTDSMVVLLDAQSQSDLKECMRPPSLNIKYASVDSIATGSALSSMESVRSSVSDGNKSIVSNESAISLRGSSLGSESSLSVRPFLNLTAPHRSLIQSAKFQILSPISDRSQEPSLDTTGFSQKSSPQDLLEFSSAMSKQKTPIQTQRNISEDFRNVHHILPVRITEGKYGSDSGISIEDRHNQSLKHVQHLEQPFHDLPFDMPKLRRRLAAAKPSLSGSNSSISSSAISVDAKARLSLPTSVIPHILNPTISRLQLSSGQSQTSSSNSSDYDTRSSADSSEEGTPKMQTIGRSSLALQLGCAAMSVKGKDIDVDLPLTKQSWYHGGINRQEAETILRNHSEGSYIVRSIKASRNEYSLALKSACGFMHFRMHFDFSAGGYTLGRSDKLFPSVPHIVSHFSIYRIPIKGAEHMVLLHPVPIETL